MTYKFNDIKKTYEELRAYGAHLVHSALTLEEKLAVSEWVGEYLSGFEEQFPTIRPVFARIERDYSNVEAVELHNEFNNAVRKYS